MLKFKSDIAKLYLCDNLELLNKLPDNYINLIYCDILYNTKSKFNDYTDDLGTPQEAVVWYKSRFIEMKRVLKDNGSIYIHCDWHLNSYIRVLMDEVFGFDNYRNEIIRQCTNAKNNSKNYGRIYDNIIYYVKDINSYIWNEIKEPKIESELNSHYNKISVDNRRYTTVPLHAKGITLNGETGKDWNSRNNGTIKLPVGRHWATSHEEMNKMDEVGQIEWSKTGNPRKILFVDDYMDKHIQNIWDMKSMGGSSLHKNVYDTQKPTEILDRIIRASSNEGDVVADFFMGCGVTGEVSKMLGRKFIGCDISERSLELATKHFK